VENQSRANQEPIYSQDRLITDILNRLKDHFAGKDGDINADCPNCQKPASKKKFSYNPTKTEQSKLGVFHCFSCGFSGNGYELAQFLGIETKWENGAGWGGNRSGSIVLPTFLDKNKEKINPATLDKTKRKPVEGSPQIRITYHPETKEPLYGVIRKTVHGKNRKGKHNKQDFQCHYDKDDGRWYWGINDFYTGPKWLYNLHHHEDKTTIYICEGQKKCDILNEILPETELAVSLHGGKNGKIEPENIPYLQGKKIIFLPDIDHDHGGQRCMIRNYLYLKEQGIDSLILDISAGGKEFSGFDIEDLIMRERGRGLNSADIYKIFEESCSLINHDAVFAFIRNHGFIQDNGKQIFESKYILDMLSPVLTKKLTLIESHQGTGKTIFARDVIDSYEKQGIKVVYLTHRTALASQIGELMCLQNYKEMLISGNKFSWSGSIVVTANSVYKLKLDHYKNCLVIIDEVDQFISHIFGETCKEERQLILITLEKLILESRAVLAMSADITEPVNRYLLNLCGIDNYNHYLNTYKPKKEAFFYNNKNKIAELINSDLSSGKRISLAHTSIEKANDIKKYLTLSFPEKKIICIDSNNSQSLEVQNILRHTEKILDYDAVIYTPAIFSGVDFNQPFAEKAYLIADCLSVDARELMQGVSRFRQAREIHFHIFQADYSSLETEPTAILFRYLKMDRAYKELKYLSRDLQYQPIETYRPYLELAAVDEADKNKLKQNLQRSFFDILKGKGIWLNFSEKNNADKEIVQAIKDANGARKDEMKQAILSADNITKEQYNQIKDNGASVESEIYQRIRYEYMAANGGEDELETIIDLWRVGEFQAIASRFDHFNMTLEENLEADRKNEREFFIDNTHHAVKTQLRQKIESALGCISGGVIDKNKKAEIQIFLLQNRVNISDTLFTITDKMIDQPMLFVRSFYHRLGLKLKRSGKNNNRRYAIDQESLELMQRILNRRRQGKIPFVMTA